MTRSTLRSITALLFGLIGFLIIPFSKSTFHLTPNLMIISTVIAIFIALCGYFYGYKSFLNPAEQIDGFIIRLVTALWFGSFGFFIALCFTGPNSPAGPTAKVIIIDSILVFIFILLGILYGYRLFLKPHITYIQSYPTRSMRIISLFYFGIMGFLISSGILRSQTHPGVLMITLLISYLGFSYGYRILLLPRSFKGALKAAVLGFIGCSFVLAIIIFCMLILPYFSNHTFMQKSVVTVIGYLLTQFILYTTVSLFIGIITMIASLLFYIAGLISRA